MIRRVYIAGPMRGYPNFNFAAFFSAEKELKEEGFDLIFNPARKDEEDYGKDFAKGNLDGNLEQLTEETGFNLREALAIDLDWICKYATHIYMLPGWEKSAGATAERATAIALGIEVMEA